jgi:hypothetical protein
MNSDPATLRTRVYALLITLAAGAVAGRILAAELVYEPSLHRNEDEPPGKRVWPKKVPTPMPTFSSNDRSRWATVRNLVEKGTYVIGWRDRSTIRASAVSALGARNGLEDVVLVAAGYLVRTKKADKGLVVESGWETLDKVLRPDTLEYYSSKPPLFSTLVAGLYWLLYQCGWTFANSPWTVVRTILLLVNWLPFLLYLHLLARLLERYGTTDWGRLYVFAAACFATLLTTFAITLNNHSIGTYCALFALYPALRIWEHTRNEEAAGPPWYLFALAGFFAAFTACNELPATAFAVFLGLALLVRAPRQTLMYFVPAAALPVAAFFLTNYLAMGQVRPAYAEFDSDSGWYHYEGSYWRKPLPGEKKSGIDWARFNKETRAEYAFHVLVGHHGLFSLSPIWLLAVVGMVLGLGRLIADCRLQIADCRLKKRSFSICNLQSAICNPWTIVALLTLLLTVIVVGFYLVKSDNYGGWTSGLRWLMWLSPLWLLTLLPVADRLGATRGGRTLAYVLLALSVLSVSYAAWNPWRHPWLYNFMQDQGWISY